MLSIRFNLCADMSLSNVLCLFLCSLSVTAYVFTVKSNARSSSSCHPDQKDALSRFNLSISILGSSGNVFCVNPSYPSVASWRESKDCCSWDGVTCDNSTGDVIRLDLSCARLQGTIDSSSPLFSLRHLRTLSLAGNDFTGFDCGQSRRGLLTVFSTYKGSLIYLYPNISGVIPAEISRLSKLVSLDFSETGMEMQDPTMRMLTRNLIQLEKLDLSYVNMSAVVPTSLANFSPSLVSLRLRSCFLGGKFPDNILQLPNLQKLDISFNYNLRGTLPGSNWSSSLADLSLGFCSFTGEVPRSIGSLPLLTSLDLSGNKFTGPIDFQTFSALKNLRSLSLSKLSISGEDATDANHKFPKLEKLVISEGTLNNFPCFLSSMPELREMELLWSNVRESPGRCIKNRLSFPQLRTLDMESCNLVTFPSFLSQSKELRFLYLNRNRIEAIPSWFWGIGIDTLETLYIAHNLIKGGLRLPWKRLDRLYLQNNMFEGPLPIPPAPSIRELIASQNRFNGSISPFICQLTSLITLALDQNNLSGVIPQCLGNLTKLSKLDLSNNSLAGPLPPSLVHCTQLNTLDVGYNSISGTPPEWIPMGSLNELRLQANNFVGRWPTAIFLQSSFLQIIDLSSNKFEGPLPLPSPTTNYYSVSGNNFSGEVSSLICQATNLWVLDLSNNSITGTLPWCLKDITVHLEYLNIRENKFMGSIPEIFPEGSSLRSLDFSRNQFEGSLPRNLSNCKRLEVLDVGGNKITDSFPGWLGDLPLKVLSLRSNKFRGRVSVPEGTTQPFSGIRVLDLSNNIFDGSLSDNLIGEIFDKVQRGDSSRDNMYMVSSDSVYQKFLSVMIDLKGVKMEMVKINVQFASLDMSSNHFQGEIPGNMGLLKPLRGLNFSHNGFTGTIPPSVGNLTNLESLDLSSNLLVGGIPRELAELTFLGFLNLSWNNLTGTIPSGGHFNTFPTGSFEGNPGLCGIPLTRSCRPQAQLPPDDGEDKAGWGWFEWKFVAMGFGSGMVIGISLGYIALETGRPLWFARMVIQLEASYGKRSKRNGRR